MSQPLVSVIIPVYNSINFVEESLNSIRQQSYENIEIILVDDHSTDGSYELLEKQLDERTFLFTNPKKGACEARNFGFSKSKGTYIQFIDADDLLSRNKIEEQIEVLINNPYCLAVSRTIHFTNLPDEGINNDHKFLFTTDNPSKFFINLWKGTSSSLFMVQTSAWLIPRKLILEYGMWDERLLKDQDGEFFARLGLNSNGIQFVDKVFNYYRKNVSKHSISLQKERGNLESNLLSTQLKEKYLFGVNSSLEAKSAMAKQYKQVAIDAYPNFYDIYKLAMSKSEELGGSNFVPVLGGKVIEFLKTLFGWRFAKYVSYQIHRIL